MERPKRHTRRLAQPIQTKGPHGWDSSTAAEDNARTDWGLANEGYASVAWLPGAGGAESVLLAGTGFKLLKIVHIRSAAAGG